MLKLNINRQAIKILSLHTLLVLLTMFVFTACEEEDNPVNPPTEEDQTIVEVAQANGNFTTLVSALQDAGLVDALNAEGPYTVFAPTDDAFASLPDGLLESLTTDQLTEILSYHVLTAEVMSGDLQQEQQVEALAGGELFVTVGEQVSVNNKTAVVTADVDASNGVIHAIDMVLLPDSYLDVVGIAQKRYTLETLVSAVATAGLVETLQMETEDGYTVFAPTDDAFAALPEGTLESLSQEQLQGILTYHVLPTKVLAGEITAGTVTTVNGATLEISVADGTVTLTDQTGNTVTVTQTDLEGTNGVVHLIDGVLMPGS